MPPYQTITSNEEPFNLSIFNKFSIFHWLLATGYWSLVTGYWSLVTGH
jgi:hypothetical protein